MSDLDPLGPAERLTREVRSLLEKVLGPAAEEVGQMLGDRMRLHRLRNVHRMLEAYRAYMETHRLEASRIPLLKEILPIVEHASLEDDADLTRRWAQLLASTTAGDGINAGYPAILAQLSPTDARVLDVLFDQSQSSDRPLPALLESVEFGPGFDFETLTSVADNLNRLGLCRPYPTLEFPVMMRLTRVGYYFVAACRGPAPAEDRA